MKPRFLLFLGLLAGVCILIAGAWLWPADRSAQTPAPRAAVTVPSQPKELKGQSIPPAKPAITQIPVPLADEMERLLSALQRGEATPGLLAAFRNLILGADPAQAMAVLTAFLNSGRDAPTGEGFTPGAGGALEGAPTLRVLALDLLGRVAHGAGSQAAVAASRAVLETKSSPDEWAVSMRNVGWDDPAATTYLTAKMHEMLAYQPWLDQPSPGLLEAFDVAVFTGDPSFVPTLASLASGGNRALQRAATVALDRLSESAPLAVMNYLNSNPGQLADRPLFRADYFSKADLTQPAQQAAVENYLARSDASQDEKNKLIKELAAPGSFISDNLLTTTPPANDTARQQALGRALQNWLNTNRFPTLNGTMQATLARLTP